MERYTLAKSELEIMRKEAVFLIEGSKEHMLDELVLTNHQLVLTLTKHQGIFKRETFFKRCPLAKLQGASDGCPQVYTDKINGRWTLRLVFEDEVITLRLPDTSKRACLTWANAIELASLGDIKGALAADDGMPVTDALLDGARTAIDGIVGTVASMTGAGRPSSASFATPAAKSKASSKARPSTRGGTAAAGVAQRQKATEPKASPVHTSAKCQGCHAPLNGLQGSVVTCVYCGTTQTL